MSTAVDFSTNMAALFKRLQPDYKLKKLFEQQFAVLNVVPKKGGFKGSQMDVPLEHDHSFVSRTYTNADTQSFPGSSVKYSLTRKKLYGVGYIDSETAAASEGNMGAWLEAVANEQKNVIYGMRKRTALQMYRGAGGALGQVAAIANGDGTNDRITLTLKSDVYNFSRGMSITKDSINTTAAAAEAETANLVVRRLDWTNGYIYVGTDVDTAANFVTNYTANNGAVNDFIFAKGDVGLSIHGMEEWNPLVAPVSGENFLGIDRSVDAERLSGHRLDDTSLTIEEIVQDLAMRTSYTGNNNEGQVVLMSPSQMKQFALELDTKVQRDPGGKGRVGFRGITVDTAGGSIECLADPACPENRLRLIDPSTWAFCHLKDFVHLVMDDGLSLRVVYNADQTQFRYRHWGNMKNICPGRNAVANLPVAL